MPLRYLSKEYERVPHPGYIPNHCQKKERGRNEVLVNLPLLLGGYKHYCTHPVAQRAYMVVYGMEAARITPTCPLTLAYVQSATQRKFE